MGVRKDCLDDIGVLHISHVVSGMQFIEIYFFVTIKLMYIYICVCVSLMYIWVRSRNSGCLVTWFCYQLIAKPVNKTAAVLWPDPYIYVLYVWYITWIIHSVFFCFILLSYKSVLVCVVHLSVFLRVTSFALGQSCYMIMPSASEGISNC